MGQQGIYCGTVDISPNRDRKCANSTGEEMRLWALDFLVHGEGKGVAMVKAPNANSAQAVLKAQGAYNGTPHLYEITRIEEIIEPPCIGLINEQVVEICRDA